MVDKHVKALLAKIVDRCDNTLCNLPSTHPKHRKYFDLFKRLATIATSIAGEENILWWKEYTNNRANYDKVYYNVRVIGEILAQLPEEVRELILNRIESYPGADLILKEYKKEDLMKKIVKDLLEKEVSEVEEEEIFWEYTIEKIAGIFRVRLYPRKEWGIYLKDTSQYIIYQIDNNKVEISSLEIKRMLKETAKSFEDIRISSDYILLRFRDEPNMHEDIRKAILKLNGILNEEREKVEKIWKALEGVAIPKTKRR